MARLKEQKSKNEHAASHRSFACDKVFGHGMCSVLFLLWNDVLLYGS